VLERGIAVVCATIFIIDVDDAARVDSVIRRIEYVRRFEADTVAFLCKLIVCGTGDDLGLQACQGIVVDDGAERAGANISTCSNRN